MTELYLVKIGNAFYPADRISAELMDDIKPKEEFKAVIKKPRNLKFHKKLFALIGVAFSAWTPGAVKHKGIVIEKNRERFRKDVTITAGFHETVFNLKGELRLEAKSISFANMDELEFQELYSRFIDVILGNILSNYTKDDLDEQVRRVLEFS